MSAPDRVFELRGRTRSGALRGRDLELVRQKLAQGGFVLLPSDTCYSVAMIPENESVRASINTMIGRDAGWPVSIAYSSTRQAAGHVRLGMTARQLLETFTPGPITVVCPVTDQWTSREFATRAAGSPDRTLGIRVPDSVIEREVAALHPFGVTTAAVRRFEDGKEIRSFAEAVALLETTSDRTTTAGWFAIEGDDTTFYDHHSTVVRVQGRADVRVLREGQISTQDILASLNTMPIATEGEPE